MMLKFHKNLSQLKYMQLMDVYSEDIAATANGRSIGLAEQDFYDYLHAFFGLSGAFVAVWELEGKYCSAVRIEPWRDGYLLSGLSTAPDCRRNGYGLALVRGVLEQLPAGSRVYSHIEKKNVPSIALHIQCGFARLQDSARMLDGSVLQDFYTFCYEK